MRKLLIGGLLCALAAPLLAQKTSPKEEASAEVTQAPEERDDLSVFFGPGYTQYGKYREWQGRVGVEKFFFSGHLGFTMGLFGASATCAANCQPPILQQLLTLQLLGSQSGSQGSPTNILLLQGNVGGTTSTFHSHVYTFDLGLNFHILPNRLFDPYLGLGLGAGKAADSSGTTTREFGLLGLRINFSKDYFAFLEAQGQAYQFPSSSTGGGRGGAGPGGGASQRKSSQDKSVISVGAGLNF